MSNALNILPKVKSIKNLSRPSGSWAIDQNIILTGLIHLEHHLAF